ncbi:DNA-directed RNA polymerase subunit beta [compost metagenome]
MAKKNDAVTRRSSVWKMLLRLVLVLLFLFIALVGGMIAGYTVLGKQDMSDVFQWSTWQHVFDLVFAP